ncbi:MAG: hypothetical protein MZV70_19025 [Desulfobacterales bacterium]|nr:hypothetical protein [Desulfobacterales bacterium]
MRRAGRRRSRWSGRRRRQRLLGLCLLKLGLKPGIFPLGVLKIGFQFELRGPGRLEPFLEVRGRGLPRESTPARRGSSGPSTPLSPA